MQPSRRKVKTTRAERRDEIAQRLFTAAEAIFQSGASFTEVSVEQLITTAGIARSTFYVYFEDRGALLLELADRVTDIVGTSALSWLELPATAGRDDLKKVLAELVATYAEHRHTLAAVAEAAAYDSRVREQYGQVMNRRISFMSEHFRRQQDNGMIRASVELDEVTPWLVWMIERGLYQLISHQNTFSDSALEGLTTVVWQTLYEPAH